MNDNLRAVLRSLPVQLLKLLAVLLISCILVLIVFCMFIPADPESGTIPEKYNIWIFLIGLLLALLVDFIMEYNQITRLKYSIQKAQADITAAREMRDSLLDKAERVSQKYAQDEKEITLEYAEARRSPVSPRVRSSGDFRAVVESYPELKANEHVLKLLSQIEQNESVLFRTKSLYAEAAARFNSKIHSFPIVLLRRLCRWEDAAAELSEPEEIVSDSELGI